MKLLLVLTAVLLSACAFAQTPKDAPKPDRGVLIQADLDFGKASAAKGVEGWLSYFAEDAVIFPSRGPIVKGLAAIRKYYTEVGFTPEGLTWKPDGADIAASGELGYTYGTWEFTGKGPGGEKVTGKGKYFTEWKKQPDGSWKVVADIGSPDQPEKKP